MKIILPNLDGYPFVAIIGILKKKEVSVYRVCKKGLLDLKNGKIITNRKGKRWL